MTWLVGVLKDYGEVWYDPDGIANIVSLRNVKQRYHIQYDSNDGNGFVVTKPDGSQFVFKESSDGCSILTLERTMRKTIG